MRDNTPWHGKTKNRVLIALGALVLIAIAAAIIIDVRSNAEQRRIDIRAIGQFERRFVDLRLRLDPTFEQMAQAPGGLLAGTISDEEYQELAEGWVESFRNFEAGVRSTEAPQRLEALYEARAHYVQSATLFIDASKIFLSATDFQGPEARERSLVLAWNTLIHSAAVQGMGDRALVRIRNDYGLNDPPMPLPEPQLPEEELPLEDPPEASVPIDPADPGPPEPGDPAPAPDADQ